MALLLDDQSSHKLKLPLVVTWLNRPMKCLNRPIIGKVS
jgi:hypothetical protein